MNYLRITAIILVVFTFTSAGFGFNPPMDYQSPSAVKTGDAAIKSSPGYFFGILVATDGTNDVTIQIYDNTSGSGTKLLPDSLVITTGSSDRWEQISFNPPLPFSTGLYVDVTTSGTVNYIVYYR